MRTKSGAAAMVVVVASALASCGKPSGNEAASLPTPAAAVVNVESTPISIANLSDNDLGRVCRAAVAALNGHDPVIIKIERIQERIAYVGYRRPDDGKFWRSRCRVEGNRVIWAAMDLNGPGSGPGRWRADAEDETITYSLDGGAVKVRISYSDGSNSEESYKVS